MVPKVTAPEEKRCQSDPDILESPPGAAGPSHSNSTCGIKAPATLRSKNTAQGTAQIFGSDFHESKFCIERHVPRYVSESRETYERMSSRGGPVTDCHTNLVPMPRCP